jgi:hypothetical protein
MRRWEYRFIMCHFHEHWRPRWLDGEELSEWKDGPSMFEFSNQLGEKGWELISMHLVKNRYRMVFKRPKAA